MVPSLINIPGPLSPETMISMYIYKFQVPIFIFKFINLFAPENFHPWFQLNHERVCLYHL